MFYRDDATFFCVNKHLDIKKTLATHELKK